MKVLIADHIAEEGISTLDGCAEVDVKLGLKPEELVAIVGDYEALVVRSQTQVTAEVIRAGEKLQVIARAGVGVDNIDVDAATDRGIHIVNTPVAPAESVAEFVVMSMIALPRQIVRADAATRSNNWGFRNEVHAPELMGKTLGVVGFGRIGRLVARAALEKVCFLIQENTQI